MIRQIFTTLNTKLQQSSRTKWIQCTYPSSSKSGARILIVRIPNQIVFLSRQRYTVLGLDAQIQMPAHLTGQDTHYRLRMASGPGKNTSLHLSIPQRQIGGICGTKMDTLREIGTITNSKSDQANGLTSNSRNSATRLALGNVMPTISTR